MRLWLSLTLTNFLPNTKLHGSFRLSPDTPLAPGFYQLLLKDGRSYRIVVKGVRRRGGKAPVPALVRFLVVPEE